VNARTALVVVVILNWNTARLSAGCVASVLRQSHRNLRVVVVDNGSHDSLAPLHEAGLPFVLLRNERNLGFTGGVNTGIGHALDMGADYVWLLNNDARPDPDALAALLDAVATDERIGLASPLIRNGDADGAVEFCGGLREGNTFVTTNDPAVYLSWRERTPERIWLVGTALLLRRRLVVDIGLFDDRFFAYWEDNDYSVRSQRAGFRNIVVPDAVVRHWSGGPAASAGARPPHYHYYMARNELLFLRKHLTLRDAARPLLWAIDRQLRRLHRLRHDPVSADAVLAGLWDGLRGRGGGYDPARRPALLGLSRMVRAIRIRT
jgi:GT2 family glycosyltransferase